jgi:hypothetical protein
LRSRGRRPAVLRLPDEAAWPAPDTLINRKQVAALCGVTVPVLRGWERRGNAPRKAAQPPRDGFSEVLYLCSDVREWLDKEVARQRAAEPDPANPYQTLSLHPPGLSGKDVVMLARLEAQVSALPPEPPKVEQPPVSDLGRSWYTPAEDELSEPFPCNTRRPARSARYW